MSRVNRPLAVLTLATFAGYAAFALRLQARFVTAGYDLGIFDQAVRHYAHLQAPTVALKGVGYNVFGDHFHPIIALAAPLYWIWDDPRTLLLLQAALVAVTVPIVYRFTRRRWSARASLLVSAAFAVGWPVQSMVNFNFHEVAWGVPLVALAIDGLDRDDDRALLISAVLLLLVREDMGVVVVLLGVLRLLRRRPGRWWLGVALIVAGAAVYELATAVVLPAFSPSGSFAYWQYTALGPDLPSALTTIATRPWTAVRLFFSPWEKSYSLLLLTVPLLLLPLRSRYSLVALPLLAELFLSSRENLWVPGYHYSAMPWVILVLAAVDGAARLRPWHSSCTRLRGSYRRRAPVAVGAVFLVVQLALIVFNGHVAPLHKVANGRLFVTTRHMRAMQATVDRIPANTCVAVDDRLAPRLTRHNLVTLPGMQAGRADFVAIDLTQSDVGNFGPTPWGALIYSLLSGYRPIFQDGTLILLRSSGYHGPSPECGPLGRGRPVG